MPAKRASEGSEPQQGAAKKPVTDAAARSQCVQFFTRSASGHFIKMTDDEKNNAQSALRTYNDLNQEQKTDFARKFLTNKGKGVGWVKSYCEELTNRTRTSEKVKEGYMNRTVVGCARTSQREDTPQHACAGCARLLKTYIYIYIYTYIHTMRTCLI